MARRPAGISVMLWPSVLTFASPWATPSVPSVATKGGMPPSATRAPFATPNAVPTAMPMSSATMVEPFSPVAAASATDAKVRTAPIERSSPSVMMISVIGRASTSRIADCSRTFDRLPGLATPRAPSAKSRASSTSMTATPGTLARSTEVVEAGAASARSLIVHPEAHDVLLAELSARQLAGDPALAHDVGAVAKVHDLHLLGGDHQHRGASRDEMIDNREDLSLGPHVDAPRRLVEDEQPRLRGEPF